jgi:hypothetical protein
MASTFKNVGALINTNDTVASDVYTAPAATYAVIHSLFLSNHSSLSIAKIDVKVTTDGGITFYNVLKSASIEQNNTLIIDKPINLEPLDKLRVVVLLNEDSTVPVVHCFASILEIT